MRRWVALASCLGLLLIGGITPAVGTSSPSLRANYPPTSPVISTRLAPTTLPVPTTTAPTTTQAPVTSASMLPLPTEPPTTLDAYVEEVTPTEPLPVEELPPLSDNGINWDAVADCETGDPDVPGSADWGAETGNGFSGGLQFTISSWRGVGGTGRPSQNSKEEQIYRANLLYDQQGAGAWPHCRRYM